MKPKLSTHLKGGLINSQAQIARYASARLKDCTQTPDPRCKQHQERAVSTQATARVDDEHYSPPPVDDAAATKTPISDIARRKQANKEFFANLLSSAATKRDAKAYISRLKSPSKVEIRPRPPLNPRPQVNLGGLFGSARSVEQSPVFSQYEVEEKGFEEAEILHMALVKISNLEDIPDNVLVGIAETLCQLARLSMLPCVVLDTSQSFGRNTRQQLRLQADRLAITIDAMSSSARVVEDIFTLPESGEAKVTFPRLLLKPLRRGSIPIVLPSAYSEQRQTVISIPADGAIIALTKEFSGLNEPHGQIHVPKHSKQVSLDRIIVIDEFGGIPNSLAVDGKHVFLNLQQEYATVYQQLVDSGSESSMKHLENLEMLQQALQLLPHTASGLMATSEQAANIALPEHNVGPGLVGTRRQKNSLIHNLLTDKPAYSSSLPKGRLSKSSGDNIPPSVATFVKHGMPLTILPDPTVQPWTSTSPRITLTDPQIDLDKLVFLIDDSFNRSLDVENYLKRVNDRIAGVIIAGDYEGGAILTWEQPPGIDSNDTARLVPYLDKFAVLKKAQGAGGVADILFNAMVRTCFPNGVCWRSRKNNPVNKWYFERSRGTKKIPDMNWTMFWTTPGVPEDIQTFQDYEGVCRGVVPTWLDKKMAAD